MDLAAPSGEGLGSLTQGHPTQGSAARLQTLEVVLAGCPDAVASVDAALRITEWNPAASRMLGWARHELLGTHVHRIIPPDHRQRFSRVVESLRLGREVQPFEAERLDRHGARRPVLVHPAGLYDDGRFAGMVAILRDPPERQRREPGLAALLSALPVVFASLDENGVVTYTAGGADDPRAAPLLSRGVCLFDVVPEDDPLHDALRGALHGSSREVRVWLADQLWQCRVGPLADLDNGAPDARGAFFAGVEVTASHQAEDRLSDVLAAAPLGLMSFDAEATITHAAGAGYALVGIDAATTVGSSVLALYGENAEIREGIRTCLRGEGVDLVTEYGDRVWELHFRPYRAQGGEVAGGILIGQDATAWVRGQSGSPVGERSDADAPSPPRLLDFLDRDEITGLPGRRALQKRLAAPLAPGDERGVAVLNVDGFALVNETYGAGVADHVLRVLGERLADERDTAAVGRWHADEFVVTLDGEDAVGRLEELAGRMLAAGREPVVLTSDDVSVELRMSAGVAGTDQAPVRDLLPAAHTALRAARRSGGDRLASYEPAMAQVADPALARELRQAQQSGELVLHYQPIVSLRQDEVTSVEALVRWQHPSRGLLLPGAFIEMAERTGQVVDLGRWILEQACLAARQLVEDPGLAVECVAVNLSARQLGEPGLLDQVARLIDRTGCPPSALLLEVTETAVMADLEAAVVTLERLKELGVRLALDDFGTGYSSLLYLKHFPVDELKIDRSFVAGLGTSPNDSAIVAATVSLARTMGIVAVAEGVETTGQLHLLTRMGCDLAQGHLFSKALPLEALTSWLAERPSGKRRAAAPDVAATEEEGPAVARILRMHEEAASLHTIAAALNREGQRTRRGTRWSAQSVALVIARAQYPGLGLPR